MNDASPAIKQAIDLGIQSFARLSSPPICQAETLTEKIDCFCFQPYQHTDFRLLLIFKGLITFQMRRQRESKRMKYT